MVIEQVVGLEPRDSEESQAVYQRPLEIGLKHSTISTEGACPFIQPQSGVAALHEYVEWITDLNQEAGAGDGKLCNPLIHNGRWLPYDSNITPATSVLILFPTAGSMSSDITICLLMLSSPCSGPGSLGSGVDSV